MDVTDIGRFLLYAGLGLALLGGIVLLLGRVVDLSSLGQLPGDIRVESDGVRFYFPLTTMIILSVVLTVVVNLVLRLFR